MDKHSGPLVAALLPHLQVLGPARAPAGGATSCDLMPSLAGCFVSGHASCRETKAPKPTTKQFPQIQLNQPELPRSG